jgi:hypothetical protein
MTAKELIQKLQEVAPETQIVIRGYEDGFNNIQKLIERNVAPHTNQEADYYGEFEETKKGTKAIELWGENTKVEN